MKIAIDFGVACVDIDNKLLILKPRKACFEEIENFVCVCIYPENLGQ